MTAYELGCSDARYTMRQWTVKELRAWDADNRAVYPAPTWDYPTLCASVDDPGQHAPTEYNNGFADTWDRLIKIRIKDRAR